MSTLGPGLAARAAATMPPPLMQAKAYGRDVRLADYWVSEKYDGVRGYWDGKQLLTRNGKPVRAPAWFTAGWPKVPLDGELWAGRGRFDAAQSAAIRFTPDDAAWRELRFMVFDLPADARTFDERRVALDKVVGDLVIAWLQPVPQGRVADHRALQALLKKTINGGGEGLVLHRGESHYSTERNDDLLKLKPYEDAEATVVGHQPGKGKYAGELGALLVESPTGLRFAIGSGLSDAERREPPPVGSQVTYRYAGLHASGIPRFATFVRVRKD